MNLQKWKENASTLSIYGRKVNYRLLGDRGPVICFLHGFPTSSYDFHRCLDRFPGYRLVLHDHPGFGLSDKPRDYSYSLIEQAECALALWQALGIEEAHLVAHDYGTSVATEVLARRETTGIDLALRSLTLCNGSVHIELARLRPIQRLLQHKRIGPWIARRASFALFRRNMRRIWGDHSTIDEEELRAHWQLLVGDGGRLVLPAIAQYIRERHRYWHRWVGALCRLDIPCHILWADRDPIAVPAIASKLEEEIPDAQLSWLAGLGHYPMLEDPKRWSGAVADFLA